MMNEIPSIYEAIVTSRYMFRSEDRDLNTRKRKEYVDSISNHWRRSANSDTDIRKTLPVI